MSDIEIIDKECQKYNEQLAKDMAQLSTTTSNISTQPTNEVTTTSEVSPTTSTSEVTPTTSTSEVTPVTSETFQYNNMVSSRWIGIR
jgi:hypothetical protein